MTDINEMFHFHQIQSGFVHTSEHFGQAVLLVVLVLLLVLLALV